MNMKRIKYLSILLGIAFFVSCSDYDNAVSFGVDQQKIEIEADGGVRAVRISASGNWIASTDYPWITVSPANGRGSANCELLIDSALTNTPRRGTVRFQMPDSQEQLQIDVEQQGYAYSVVVEETQVTVPNYAAYGERYFDVKVHTNTEFSVEIPESAGWLSVEKPSFNFNRQARPREVTLRFNWQISSQPERIANVHFAPAQETAYTDNLTVTQEAAPEIERDTRAGDSVALLGISRSLDTWESWERAEPMSNWETVTLWEEGMDGWRPEIDGRVKSARFFLFSTREGLPYEVQYLTAAEELSFMSNTNSFRYRLDPGEYISKLTNLKRLTIMAYGLSTLSEDFANLKNLEYLDLSANNFESFPSVLRKENFPNLKSLILNAQQSTLVYDLSNDSRIDLGGFYAATTPDGELPRWLFEWDTLESLVLGVNYLQGHIPTLEDDPTWTSFYTEEDVIKADTLPRGNFYEKNENGSPKGIVGLPKVWPKMTHFTINYNRMTGSVPDWMLYHPAFDWWIPFTFVFNQEGKDETGRNAGFDNEPPTTMEYYYNFYPQKDNPYGNSSGGAN